MKKLLTVSALFALILSAICFSGCNQNKLDTDQYAGTVALAAIAPNPVMRGGELRIIGSNLENVSEVRFAGDVIVKDIQVISSGPRSEIRVTVPLVGPVVGPVSIATLKGDTASTRFDLEFTEPIEVSSITPEEAYPGETLTIMGEYLNDVREVIFGGEVIITEFVSQSREKLEVIIPSNAVSGYVIVGDVNELEDENTIPNRVYSPTALIIEAPTVVTAEKATYKSGDVIIVTGEHLDMIETVNLQGAKDVDFTVSEDGTSISFNLPPTATDGNIELVSYAGDSFDGGEIETVTVADLSIASLAEDARYKAGTSVKITGSDLDLVTKVEFANAGDVQWYLEDDAIIATIPAKANDGVVTVTLDSGKQAYTEAIEVVKPVISGWDDTGVAGKDENTIVGQDLDLVTSVTIGTKDNGIIDCEFSFDEDDNGDPIIIVKLPKEAYTAPITVTAESGYADKTPDIIITYDEVVSIVFDQPSYELGTPITISGENLMKIESIYIVSKTKNEKVTVYSQRADDAMAFMLPNKISTGIYRLGLTLIDGTQMTWSVPFTVTAMMEKRVLWEGNLEINWNDGKIAIPAESFKDIPGGTLMYVCYTQKDQVWGQAQFNYGDWSHIAFTEGDVTFTGELVPTDVYGWFADGQLERVTPVVLTDEILANIQAKKGDFNGIDSGIIIQGSDLIFTEIYVEVPAAVETVIWEGSLETGDYANNLEIGGEDDWVNKEFFEGAEVRIYFTAADPADWSMQVFDGHWNAMEALGLPGEKAHQFNQDNTPGAIAKGYLSFKAEGDIFTQLTTKAWWGSAIILQGKNLTVTKVAFI